MSTSDLILRLAQILATLLVGGAACFIAWEQWRLAQRKLKMDLFEKRYATFNAVRAFLSHIFRQGRLKDETLPDFFLGTSDAEFLFPAEIVGYINEIKTHAFEMRDRELSCEGVRPGPERSKLVDLTHEELRWLLAELPVLKEKFKPYLAVGADLKD